MILDRILETSTGAGTGDILLLGAKPKYRGFSLFGVNPFFYVIEDSDDIVGTEWELGQGLLVAGSLQRVRVIASSSGAAKVDLSPGKTWRVFNTVPKEYLDGLSGASGLAGAPIAVPDIADEATMLALSPSRGDYVIRTDLQSTFINITGKNLTMADWKKLGFIAPPSINEGQVMVSGPSPTFKWAANNLDAGRY